MGVFNVVFPIQAGREEDARAFAAELVGAQLAGYEAHHARVGNTRETFTLQETPMGSFLLVWFEGDVQKAFADHATDDSDFETWFRARVLDLTGVDLAAPPAGPLPRTPLRLACLTPRAPERSRRPVSLRLAARSLSKSR
jgi:hypothetical protein